MENAIHHHLFIRPTRLSVEDYNYERYQLRDLRFELRGQLQRAGMRPGDLAPDFVLPTANGGQVRLSAMRDRPVLLHFGSYT